MSKRVYTSKTLSLDKQKYRIDITDDDTYAHVITLHTSRKKVVVLFLLLVISIIVTTISIIAFSPLKYYIPDLEYARGRENIEQLKKQVDSLQIKVEKQDKLYNILQLVIKDDLETIEKYDSLFFENYPIEEN